MVVPSVGPAAVADQAKRVDPPYVETAQLVGVEGEEVQETLQVTHEAGEPLMYPWCHWPDQQLEV